MEGNSTEDDVLPPATDLLYKVTAKSVFLVFGIDICVWVAGVLLFIFVHYISFYEPSSTAGLTGKNKVKNWLHQLFYRQTKTREPEKTMFLWIWRTLKLSGRPVLDATGRDGYMYLRLQRQLIFLLFSANLILLPSLLYWNEVASDTDAPGGFDNTTALFIDPGSTVFWVHAFATAYMSIGVLLAIVMTLRYLKTHRTLDELVSVRFFTARIENVPREVKDPRAILDFIRLAFPSFGVLQIYIVHNLSRLAHLLQDLQRVDSNILSYEVQLMLDEKRPTVRLLPLFKSPISFGVNCLCSKIDAINYFYDRLEHLERKIEHQKQKPLQPSGMVLVTFKTMEEADVFIDRAALQIQKSPTYKSLGVGSWIFSHAPDPSDIIWDNVSITPLQQIVRFALINSVILFVLFFFTTPISMIDGIRTYLFVSSYSSWIFSNSFFAAIFGDYFPTLLLLLITFIVPHILYFTTKLEGYHTTTHQNSVGMYKVFSYQFTSILILPSFALGSLLAMLRLGTQDVEEMWHNGEMFPNGLFFLKYVMQAALIGTLVDLWRLGEVLMEKLRKLISRNTMESRRAEQIDPFMFGYEYQYILLMFSITLFYTVVTPVILPVGLVFMCLKHFVDKYNLIYIYPKAPESDNQLTQRVIGLIFFVLVIYQVVMTGFLVLYKGAILPGMFVVAIGVVTAGCGVYILGFYFSEIKKERKVLGKGKVNLENFKNCYNNPCKVLEKQLYSRKNVSKLLSNNFVRTASEDLAEDQVIEVQDSWSEVSPPFYARQEYEEEYVTDVVEIDSDPNPPISYSPDDLSIVEIDADLPSHPHPPHHDESPSTPSRPDQEEVYEEIDLDSA